MLRPEAVQSAVSPTVLESVQGFAQGERADKDTRPQRAGIFLAIKDLSDSLS